MNIEVWGCRGSLASPGPRTRAVRRQHVLHLRHPRRRHHPGARRRFGHPRRSAAASVHDPGVPIHIFLTHLHLDHLQGLAFFAPFWTAGVELHVWGPPSATAGLDERVARYLGPPLFPIHLNDVPVRRRVPRRPRGAGGRSARRRCAAASVSHQGPTVGYRVDDGGRSVAYIPDHEPSLGIDITTLDVSWLSGYELLDGADVAFHDAQYFDEEYENHLGWGHSAISHAVTSAARANVGQLVLFHHDPGHTDDDLDRLARPGLRAVG